MSITFRNVMLMALQLSIIKIAIHDGWVIKIINENQIELSRKWDYNDNYENICKNLIERSGIEIFGALIL